MLIRRMPLVIMGYLFHFVGTMYHVFHIDERRKYLKNILNFAKPLSRTDADEIYFRAKKGLYEHYLEKMLVATRPLFKIRKYIDQRSVFINKELLDKALAKGKGVILVTAHFGAVELIPALLYTHNYPVSIVMETTTPLLARSLNRIIQKTNVELIIESAGARVLNSCLDALKRGRILMTQVDEVDTWRRRKSNTIQIFNQTLFFDHMLDFISQRTTAPAVGVYGRRLPGRKYQFTVEEILHDIDHTKIAHTSYLQWERFVLEHPDQWYQWKKWDAMIAPEDDEVQIKETTTVSVS
jgi:KDO2-lipid IV(A) lauroyltransferase